MLNPPNRKRQRGFLSAVIGAGASLIGGMMNKSSQRSANQTNAAQASENNALSDSQFQQTFRQQQKNYERDVQRNELQFYNLQNNAIRNRVSDARKAGVHPLYALGASSSGASPAQVSAPLFGQPPGRDRAVVQPNDGMGKGLAAAARAGAGYFARNKVDEGIARAHRAEQVLLTSSEIHKNNAITEWYKRGGPNPAIGRDTIAKNTAAVAKPKITSIGKAVLDDAKIKPQEHSASTSKEHKRNKYGGTSSREFMTEESSAGEAAPVVNATAPYFEQIGSLSNFTDKPSKTVKRLRKAVKSEREKRKEKYRNILKKAGVSPYHHGTR